MASRAVTYSLALGVLALALLAAAVAPAEAAAPPNNAFSAALVVSPLPYANTQSTVDATLEGNEEQPSAACTSGTTGKTIWYQFTPAAGGVYDVSARDSDFDTLLAVYTGSTVSNLTEVACNDDTSNSLQSQLTFSASAGTTYRIQLGGWNGDSGTATLKVRAVPPAPANDNFESAENVGALPFTDSSDNTLASVQTGEPPCGVAAFGKTLWYRFQPAASGEYVIDTVGSSFNTMLAAFTGSALTGLTQVGCNDNIGGADPPVEQSRLTLTLTAGTVYWLRAGGYTGRGFTEYGTLVLNVTGAGGGTADSDGDGCADSRETEPTAVTGGDRDPNNHWDFFDVTGDSVVNLSDTLVVLNHFGHGHSEDALDPELDRYSPDSTEPYRTAEATGARQGITLEDVLANLAGFGHDCS